MTREQSTHGRTDELTDVLPPKATSSPSPTRASARQGLISLSYSARCIDPRHPTCGWTAEGPGADEAARRLVGELRGGPRHATVTEGKP